MPAVKEERFMAFVAEVDTWSDAMTAKTDALVDDTTKLRAEVKGLQAMLDKSSSKKAPAKKVEPSTEE